VEQNNQHHQIPSHIKKQPTILIGNKGQLVHRSIEEIFNRSPKKSLTVDSIEYSTKNKQNQQFAGAAQIQTRYTAAQTKTINRIRGNQIPFGTAPIHKIKMKWRPNRIIIPID
jgi:hypothetical protein